jgi:glucose/arabinose dehydrogenase
VTSKITLKTLILVLGLALLLAACAPEGETSPPPADPLEPAQPLLGDLPDPTPPLEDTPQPPAGPSQPILPFMTPTPTAEVGTAETPVETAAVPANTPTPAPIPETGADPTAGEPFDTVVGLELVAAGFAAPLVLESPRDGTGRLFIADQTGQIYVLSPEGQLLEQPFLDLRDRMVNLSQGYDERGLLGLAFHPDFAQNQRFFVYYSAPLRSGAPAGWDHTSHISEFVVSAQDPDRADPNSERILLQVDQPQGNHNAGQIAFGPADGYLYIPLGDGGGANDTGPGHPALGHGQDTTTLKGSILRIDVDNGDPYAIPPDNPFANGQGREEIYAYGLRNPYKISFDIEGQHQLFAADAGQNLWEEVNIIEPGGNYGWNLKEGTHCFNPANPNQVPAECPATGPHGEPLLDPAIEYANSRNPQGGIGLVVIGGYVYRGSHLPELQGRYIFGDWSTSFGIGQGILLAATRAAQGELWEVTPLQIAGQDSLGEFLLSFGQDEQNELYVLTSSSSGPSGSTGSVYRLVPAADQE